MLLHVTTVVIFCASQLKGDPGASIDCRKKNGSKPCKLPMHQPWVSNSKGYASDAFFATRQWKRPAFARWPHKNAETKPPNPTVDRFQVWTALDSSTTVLADKGDHDSKLSGTKLEQGINAWPPFRISWHMQNPTRLGGGILQTS